MPDSFVYCSRCGTQNADTAELCQKCGSPMAPASALTFAVAPPAPLASVAAGGTAAVAAYAPPVAIVAGPRYAGFWIRWVAYLLDSIITGALFVPIFIVFLLPTFVKAVNQINAEEPTEDLFKAIALMIPVLLAIRWLYEALTTCSTWQGTVGKRVLRLKVTDEAGNRISFGRSTGRYFSKLLSRAIMSIGFFMIGFTDRKRGLHDMIAGTLVIRE